MVPARGIEPRNGDLQGRCCATEPRGRLLVGGGLAVAGAGHDASFGAIFKIASCDRMVPG